VRRARGLPLPYRIIIAQDDLAAELAGSEGDLFRKVLCVLVYLQSTAVLDWMVVK
jgi:hypothetical protein